MATEDFQIQLDKVKQEVKLIQEKIQLQAALKETYKTQKKTDYAEYHKNYYREVEKKKEREPKHCTVCNKEVKYFAWNAHLKTKGHLQKEAFREPSD